jgi:hypothetical protein
MSTTILPPPVTTALPLNPACAGCPIVEALLARATGPIKPAVRVAVTTAHTVGESR